MAEGFAKNLLSETHEAFSAGTSPHGINQYAQKVMKEVGIDISTHSSDHINKYKDLDLDTVVTVCDNAASSCPSFDKEGVKVIHAPFDDPPALVNDIASEEDTLNCFRRVRDEIEKYIQTLK